MGFDDGSAQVRNMRDPGQPTVKEHQEHMTTHRPYRSWCKFCVMGRGVNAPHRRSDAHRTCQWTTGSLESGNLKSTCLPCWSPANGDTRRRGQCWFRGKERSSPGSQREQQDSLTNLDTTQSRSGVTTSQRLKRWQGKSDKHAKKVARLFQRDRQWEKAGPMESSNVPWGSWPALEHRIGTRVPSDARILCWLVEFAAYLMNRCDIGSDGKTPLQRLHVRRDNTPILEFGEKILYMPAEPARGRKWEPRFHPGVFVGMLNSSSEAVVVTEQGTAIKTRSANIGRIPESERWDADKTLGIRAVPWSPDGSDNALNIQVGMERPAEMVPRDAGEVLMEQSVLSLRNWRNLF